MTSERPIQQVYAKEDGSGFISPGLSHTMFWDEWGAYIGQEQPNVIDFRDANGEIPPVIFFPARGNQAGQFGLTRKEMEEAIKETEGIS